MKRNIRLYLGLLIVGPFIVGPFLVATSGNLSAQEPDSSKAGKVLLQDDFDRAESKPELEEIGNGWGTNSKTRAKGNKQVDMIDGAMHIYRHEVADHGVSVTHDLKFRDATIELRFKLGEKDDLGINIADMKEKSVHAGHLCVARIRLNQTQITDLKTGTMDLALRTRRKAGRETAEDKKLVRVKSKSFKTNLTPDVWHQLQVKISGDEMSVTIDGQLVGKFSSPGIAHSTKDRLRLAVNRSAWVDDVLIRSPDAAN